jgi:hypothetical protein
MSEHSKSSPLKMYFGIWITLLVCTYVTYKAAFIELGRFNAAVALGLPPESNFGRALLYARLARQRKTHQAGGDRGAVLPAAVIGTHHVRLCDAVVELGLDCP